MCYCYCYFSKLWCRLHSFWVAAAEVTRADDGARHWYAEDHTEANHVCTVSGVAGKMPRFVYLFELNSLRRTIVMLLVSFHRTGDLMKCYCDHSWKFPLSPPIDSIWAVMIVWRLGGKIIRTVLCYVVYNSCTQWYAHTYIQFLNLHVVLYVCQFVMFSNLCVIMLPWIILFLCCLLLLHWI